MKHDSRKTFSGRFTDSVRAKFNEVSEQFPDYTDSQIVEEIVKQCAANVQTDNSAVIDNLQSELDNLTAERDNLVASNDELTAKIEELKAECEQWKQTANENGVGASAKDAEVEKLQEENKVLKSNLAAYEHLQEENENLHKQIAVLQNPQKGSYTVHLGDVASEMMELTVNRLKDRLKTEDITPEKILVDLFVKYTKERPCDFAYPLVISKTESQMIIDRHRKK